MDRKQDTQKEIIRKLREAVEPAKMLGLKEPHRPVAWWPAAGGRRKLAHHTVYVLLLLVVLPVASRAGTIAYWTFEDRAPGTVLGGGDTVVDSGPNNLSATAVGDPTYSSSRALLAPGSTSLQFDGTDFLTVADDDLLDFTNSESFTIELFFRTAGFGVIELLQKEAGGPIGYEFFLSNDRLRFHIFNGLGEQASIQSVDAVNDDQWHHAAGVRDHAADTVRLYIDGVSQGSSASSDNNVDDISNSIPLSLGDGNSSPFVGFLDEIRFSDQVLSPSQFLITPEPGTLALLGLGIGVLVFARSGHTRR